MKVIYLKKKLNKQSRLTCGLVKRKVDVPVRILELGVVYPEIEQVLLNVQLTHPRGNWDI